MALRPISFRGKCAQKTRKTAEQKKAPLKKILDLCWRTLKKRILWRTKFIDAGWSSMVARQAHNLKVIGSNPIPAPILARSCPRIFFCIFLRQKTLGSWGMQFVKKMSPPKTAHKTGFFWELKNHFPVFLKAEFMGGKKSSNSAKLTKKYFSGYAGNAFQSTGYQPYFRRECAQNSQMLWKWRQMRKRAQAEQTAQIFQRFPRMEIAKPPTANDSKVCRWRTGIPGNTATPKAAPQMKRAFQRFPNSAFYLRVARRCFLIWDILPF